MNEKLNIQDLIDLLAEKHGMSKKNADSFVKEFFQLIEEALEKDKYVKIKGLGAFKLIDVESRESVNVNTGERFEIQGHTKVSFTPEPALKDIINKPFAHFETVVLNEGTVLEDTPVDSGSEEDEDTEQKVEDVVPEVVAGSTVEIPEIAEKTDSPVGQLDGAHAAVLHHQKSHRLDVDARAGAAAEQVLVGGVLAVEVGACGSKAERDAGHRQDGGAVIGLDGLADDGVGICHLADLVHRDVH